MILDKSNPTTYKQPWREQERVPLKDNGKDWSLSPEHPANKRRGKTKP